MLVFDIETDGLLDTLTHIKCINMIDRETGAEMRFTDAEFYRDDKTGELTTERTPRTGTIADGISVLEQADCIVGHNAIEFDVPAIQMVYPEFSPQRVLDTKILSRLIWTDLRDRDVINIKKRKYPSDFLPKWIGSHSLRPWGVRLGFRKDDYDPTVHGWTWQTYPFTKEVDDYCMQDVRVTVRLMERIEEKEYSPEAIELEHAVAEIIFLQQQAGFAFDTEAARRLTASLQVRRLELETQARSAFEPWLVPHGPVFTPKRDNRVLGYTAGASVQRLKLVEFNPGSRDHVASRLRVVRGWEPLEFTTEGKPKVDEAVLSALPYPEAKLLSEYFAVQKRLGQLAEGKEAWLKAVKDDGRIHGSVNTNGAVTGRMTHYGPNVAQADKDPAMRSLWIARSPEWRLVGCDAEGLELRMLGHFMAKWDGGAFIDAVVNGRKEDGTDVHSMNMRLAGFRSRDSAKTLIYALIYGAGDYKLGTIALDDFDDAKRDRFNAKYSVGSDARRAAVTRLGRALRAKIMEGLPALASLTDAVKAAARSRGYLLGLDGRHLHVRAEHSALNTLLQSGGALVMKKALVILRDRLTAAGLVHGPDYVFVANIHDEFQIEARAEHAEDIGRLAADSIAAAGQAFRLKCPMAGAFAVGRSWAETH